MAAKTRRWLARVLTVIGLVCLGYYGYVAVSATAFQREQRQRFEALRTTPKDGDPRVRLASSPRVELPSSVRGGYAPLRPVAHEDRALADGVVGLLEIPRLGISTPVVSGDDEESLEIAVGHLPDTPLPWESGNAAVAAHRDGLFRPLKDVRKGDRVIVRTTRGDLEYEVRAMKVVRPTDLSVLEPLDADALTLITCYPFNYVGSAPRRFIVHAIRTSGAMAADEGLLPARPLSTAARYSAASDARPDVAPKQTTGERRAKAQRAATSRGTVAAGQKARAARASARKANTSAASDRRARVTLGDARGAPSSTKNTKAKDDAPRKRRWYHIFTRG